MSGGGETPGHSQDPAPEAAAAEEATAPVKRTRKPAARKAAPRKRATKAEAAAALDDAAGGDAVAQAAALVLQSPGEPVVQAVEDDPAVAQSASEDVVPAALVAAQQEPGSAAPVAGTAGAGPAEEDVAEALQDAGEPVVAAREDDPSVVEAARDDVVPAAAQQTAAGRAEEPVAEEPAAEPAPAARTRRRRAPAVVTFQAPEAEPDVPAPTEEEPSPAPRRRRRAGTTGALPPSALIPTLLAPEPVAVPEAERGDEALVEEPGEAGDEALDETEGPSAAADEAADDDRPRRRRRGRRGRSGRRDDEATDADGSEALPDDDEEGGTPRAAGAEADATEDEAEDAAAEDEADEDDDSAPAAGTRRRRRRRRRGTGVSGDETPDEVHTVVHVREPRTARVRGASAADEDGVRGITGSTRMAAKRARRQEGRDSGRRRPPVLSEAEFLARREAVDRTMVVRQQGDRTQIAVLEDGVLVEHYVTRASAQSYAGNVYLGRVQNVLPSMEAAFVDIGKGKNGVLYAGEVSYDAQPAGSARKIEQVLKSGQEVLVQVTKDPMGHKGARLTSQVSLPGRYLVYVPEGSMTGISRKLPENERNRLKAVLKKVVPEDAGVIVRTAAEGASEEDLAADVRRLQAQWEVIRTKATRGGAPALLHSEPDLVIRVVRDVFNEDFTRLVVQGDSEWDTIRDYVEFVAPDLAPRLSRHDEGGGVDVFAAHRIDEQLAKALDRKVWLPSGGSLVIDRTEAMVVIDVNTGKYVGKGGNLEETVTRNNLEAAEEIARQLRLRDLGGMIVVDFIDMVLESNRDLVVRRLVECLGRDRTKHQVAEVTSLGLVQMTRKRVGQGLLESFSEPCEACGGRGVLVHDAPVEGRPDREDRVSRERRSASVSRGVALVAAASGHALAEETTAPAEQSAGAVGATEGGGDGREPGSGRRRRRGGRGAGAAAPVPDVAVDSPDDDGAPDVPTGGSGDGALDPAAAAPDGAVIAAAADDSAVDVVQAGTDDQAADAAPGSGPAVLADPVASVDAGPELVPELAEQPAPADEDLPVVPDVLVSVTDPEPQDAPAADGVPAAQDAAGAADPSAAGEEAAGAADPSAAGEEAAGPDALPAADAVPFAEALPPAQAVPAEEAAPALAAADAVVVAAAPRRRRRATSRPAGPPSPDR